MPAVPAVPELTGDPAAGPVTWPGHEGLFGPDSVTWRIMNEAVVWVAGLRSLYLQALNPRAIRATWQNTGFADRREAWGRFVRTAEFVRVRTYGSAAEAERQPPVLLPRPVRPQLRHQPWRDRHVAPALLCFG